MSHTGTRQLSHDALFYSSDTEFTAALTPFLRQGLDNGDALICAVTAPNIDLLRQDLGGDAEHVHFIDRDEWYRRPAVTIAGWQRLLDQAVTSGHPFVRIIGEVAFGDLSRHPTWTRYESALNELFAPAPAWIVCPYNNHTLHPQVLADARRTHPNVFDPIRRPSDAYLPTAQLLTQVAETLPTTVGAPALDMIINEDATSVAAARQAAAEVATRSGATQQIIEDLQLVVSELAGNSLLHGSGERRLRLWTEPDAFTGEVTDEGNGLTDPLAGYQAPPAGTPGGWGLWISQQLCDQLAVTRDAATTRARFRITR